MTTNARPTNRLIGTEAEHYEDMEAVHNGTASELFRCPVDDSLQGVTETYFVPGRGIFDAGEIITLRCGHTIV